MEFSGYMYVTSRNVYLSDYLQIHKIQNLLGGKTTSLESDNQILFLKA